MAHYFQVRHHSVLDRDYWDAVKSRIPAAELTALNERCDKIPERFEIALATDYLAAKRNNDRARIDRYRGNSVHSLSALAIRRCLLGVEPDDKLLNWIFAIVAEPTWVLSAHLDGSDLPLLGTPRLDLTSCGMTALFAEMTEVLKPWMDSQSATLAQSIVAEIDRRTLTPYGDGFKVGWENPKRTTNWLGVCAGNILAACESLAALGQPRPAARARAMQGLSKFVRDGFTEHGECDEGMGYWTYGVGEACMGLSRLSKDELAANFDLERLRVVASYPRTTHLFDNYFFSANDGGLTCGMGANFVPWLAALFQDEWLNAWVARAGAKSGFNYGFSGWLRVLNNPQPDRDTAAPSAVDSQPRYLHDQQVGIFRTPTQKGELLICLSGGHNEERHNHNDLGHFIVAHGGKFIIPDLHPPDYTVDFFSPKRYTYESASSRGHCCPLIDGVEQRTGLEAAGKLLAWRPDGEAAFMQLDLTAAYPAEAGLLSWTRALECRPQSAQISISDAYRTQKPGATIVHRLWSFEKPELQQRGGGSEGFRFSLGTLNCGVTAAPAAYEFKAFDPKAFGIGSYPEGVTLHRIDLTYRTDDHGKLEVATRFS